MTRTRLSMIFTGANRDRAVSIQNPRDNLTVEIVEEAADNFVSANPFDDSTGTITALRRAEVITTEEIDLIIAS